MAFKSEAQRKKMKELVKAGKITQATFDAFEDNTSTKKLPDRLAKPLKKGKIKKVKTI
jgi:hypothetical protein